MASGMSIDWLKSELATLLAFDDTEEIAKYVLSIGSAEDREEYLRGMLDPDQSQSFFTELRARESASIKPPSFIAYKKSDNHEQIGGARPKSVKQGQKENTPPKPIGTNVEETSKKKSKFVALYSSEGQAKDVVLLKGRHPCDCQASKHELVNNCLQCGKIVCKQEGSGPCLFCGALVCNKEETEVLNRNSKKSEVLKKKLLAIGQEDGLVRAEQHKQMLLEYDKTSEARTKVIDDESDYFSLESNQWLTPDQRKALQKRSEEINQKRHGSRLDKKFTFDFTGRRVVEDDSDLKNYNPDQDEVVQEIYHNKKSNSFSTMKNRKEEFMTLDEANGIANQDISVPRPMLVESSLESQHSKTRKHDPSGSARTILRLQDPQLQEMSDEGFCLSMHQPWASYLVAGIKIHEGRTWYSPHRGRLWIHAASREPTKEEIAQVQQQHSSIRGGRVNFPSVLPTGCLLGCVDVTDCLGQEEYRDRFPDGESDSPFVFICTNPQELLVKFPMTGQHKIYKLDPKIHQAAKKAAKKSVL